MEGKRMLDLKITGGTVVSPSESTNCDVGIKDGRVVLLASPGTDDATAVETIDASGQYVVPGGIDPHVHFNLGLTPAMHAQSATAGSLAAAFGGTTTFIDFALQREDMSLVSAIDAKQAELSADRPEIDYALHCIMAGNFPSSVMAEIPEAISGGVSSFKVFTTFSGASASGTLMTDDGRIWGLMKSSAKHGAIVMAHCEDDCIIDFNVRKLYEKGQEQGSNISLARPNLAEEAAVRRLMLLSRRSDAPLYVVHVSTAQTAVALHEAQAERRPVYGEVLHNYLTFTEEKYQRPDGLLYHNYPPLRSRTDQSALWQAVCEQGLQTVASDDFTVPRERKLVGQQVDNVSGGHNGIETRMNVMFSEAVATGRMSINRFVDVTSTTAARLFGLYPHKGVIAPGSDADIVLIDPSGEHTYRQPELHSDCDYSLWDNWHCNGRLTATISRGRVLVKDQKWVGSHGNGNFVPSANPSTP